MRRSVPPIVLAGSLAGLAGLAGFTALARAADSGPVYLQALTPTSGEGAAAVLEEGSHGWSPAGDSRDEGLLFRFERPTPLDSVRLTPCAGAEFTIILSADGAEVATAKLRASGTALQLPGGGKAVRSVFVRIAGPRGCLAQVAFSKGGAALPVRPPRSVPGTVTASSTLAPIDAYLPSYLFDGRLDFGWVEGAKGIGVGESVTVKLAHPAAVSALEIWNGYQRSADHFKKNARAKRVSLTADGKPAGTFALKDAMGSQKLALPSPVTASAWTLRIDEAVPGSVYPDLVISELRFWDAEGPFTVSTSDAKEREAALRAEIAGGPLPDLLDREWVAACGEDGARHLKLRGNHTFVWYEDREPDEVSAKQEVFDGVWIPTRPGGPWAKIELYGRRHRIERTWRPYEDAARRETDRIGGGNVEVARLADLGPDGWKALYSEWKGGESAGRLACIGDAGAYEDLVKRNAVVVRGAPFQDLLISPQ
jgi:hypothetical protein